MHLQLARDAQPPEPCIKLHNIIKQRIAATSAEESGWQVAQLLIASKQGAHQRVPHSLVTEVQWYIRPSTPRQ